MSTAPLSVTDTLSNLNDQMANAARLIGRSKDKQKVFEAVYYGKRQIKTIEFISRKTGLSKVRVLQAGGDMANFLFEKVHNGYKKRKEFAPRYRMILVMAKDKKKLERLSTKISPKINIGKLKISVDFPKSAQNARLITIDDIDSFSKVKGQSSARMGSVPEKKIKQAFKKIIGESGNFKDWGGEKSDLYTTKIYLGGRRIAGAIAFKGKGTKGKLVPAKMGKNGDQINRLFEEPAQVFLIVYSGQVDPSIISQMKAFAIGKAISGQKVCYGVIDGDDLRRLISAYPDCF